MHLKYEHIKDIYRSFLRTKHFNIEQKHKIV